MLTNIGQASQERPRRDGRHSVVQWVPRNARRHLRVNQGQRRSPTMLWWPRLRRTSRLHGPVCMSKRPAPRTTESPIRGWWTPVASATPDPDATCGASNTRHVATAKRALLQQAAHNKSFGNLGGHLKDEDHSPRRFPMVSTIRLRRSPKCLPLTEYFPVICKVLCMVWMSSLALSIARPYSSISI